MHQVGVAAFLRSSALRFLAPSVMLVFFVAPASAKTLRANCRKSSTNLQTVIDSASDGDVVAISGVCVGNFVVPGTSLTLLGFGKRPTLDGGGGSGIVVSWIQSMNRTASTRLTISGLTIRNGGGGVVGSFLPLTLTRSVIANNSGEGIGSIFADIVIDSSTIANNEVGMHLSQGSHATITKTWFANNSEVGLSLHQCSSTIRKSVFSGNGTAGRTFSAGGIENFESDSTVTDSTITRNVGVNGAGIFTWGGLTLMNSVVSYNVSVGAAEPGVQFGGGGGGIYFQPDSDLLVLSGDKIIGNKTDGNGGGLWLLIRPRQTISIEHTLFASNYAGLDGGGVSVFSQLDVSALTNIFDDTDSIKSNSAGTDGGGVCDMGDVLTFPTGVVSHNTPDDFCASGM
jgi:hypothetical protein